MRPVSPNWGYDRGLPIDRWYIERFLRRFAGSDGYIEGDIRGVVMEVGGDEYALACGREVERIEVLHADASNPAATIVGDLVSGEGLPERAYDCVICTETLHLLYDIHAAVRTLHGTLKPGGVALVTIPSLSRIAPDERDRWGDYWRVTSLTAERMFGDVFGPGNVQVEPYGNLLAALGSLRGLAAEELAVWELEMRDPEFEGGIGVRARRAPQ